MNTPIGKTALDAMTDASFASARDERASTPRHLLFLSGEAAAILAEQFPGQEQTAARAVMCVVQMLAGAADQVSEDEAQILASWMTLLALAAEQVTREAGGEPA